MALEKYYLTLNKFIHCLACTEVHMNTDCHLRHNQQHKTRNNPFVMFKIIVI